MELRAVSDVYTESLRKASQTVARHLTAKHSAARQGCRALGARRLTAKQQARAGLTSSRYLYEEEWIRKGLCRNCACRTVKPGCTSCVRCLREQARTQANTRDERRSHGLCARCGKSKPQRGKRSCKTCLVRYKEYGARARKKRRAAHSTDPGGAIQPTTTNGTSVHIASVQAAIALKRTSSPVQPRQL